ncbi:hypothetical protein NL475_26285, partial [Klebsiella pneumoniae]|nr:hypothetical protein [Klebsiella pneumoniae]
ALVAQGLRLLTLAWMFGPEGATGRGRSAARMRAADRLLTGLSSVDPVVSQWLELERGKCHATRAGVLDRAFEDRSARGMAAAHRLYLKAAE